MWSTRYQTAIDLTSVQTEKFLQDHFKGRTIRIIPIVNNGPVSQCYNNVRQVAQSLGGKPQFGWLFSWLPGFYIEAMHHAVWRKPNGELADVTLPAFERMPPKEIQFLSDNTISVGVIDPAVSSIFEQLHPSELVGRYIEVTIDVMKTISAKAEILKSSVRQNHLGQISLFLNMEAKERIREIDIEVSKLRREKIDLAHQVEELYISCAANEPE